MRRSRQNTTTPPTDAALRSQRQGRLVLILLPSSVAITLIVIWFIWSRSTIRESHDRDAATVTQSTQRQKPHATRASADAAAPLAQPPVSDGAPLSTITGLSNARFHGELEAEIDRVDPQDDGWDTEAFSERALTQLKALGKLISQQPRIEPAMADFVNLLAGDFACGPLRPPQLSKVFADRCLAVWRSADSAAMMTSLRRTVMKT